MNSSIPGLGWFAMAMPGADTGIGANAQATAQQIARAGSQHSIAGGDATFTGRVRIDPLWPVSDGTPPQARW